MKRASRKCRNQNLQLPPAGMREYLDFLIADHTMAWEVEVTSPSPRWQVVLGLHLRLAELEHLEEAAGELL